MHTNTGDPNRHDLSEPAPLRWKNHDDIRPVLNMGIKEIMRTSSYVSRRFSRAIAMDSNRCIIVVTGSNGRIGQGAITSDKSVRKGLRTTGEHHGTHVASLVRLAT